MNASLLKYNYFYINDSFIHKMKRTAMSTHIAGVQASLTYKYSEVKLFNKLPKIYSYDIVEFFLKDYNRFFK